MAINYKSAVVITEGVKLLVGKLAINSRVPASYGLVADSAAAANATSISVMAEGLSLVSGDDLLVSAGTELMFGSSKAIVTDDTIVDQLIATALPVEPLAASIATSATATTLALLPVLGLTEASPQNQTTMIDTTDFLAGFAQQSVVTGVNRTFNCSGHRIQGDRAMDKIVMPLILDDKHAREEIYFQLLLPSGEIFEGAGKVENLNFTTGLRDIVKYTFSLQAQGLSSKYTPSTVYAAAKNA